MNNAMTVTQASRQLLLLQVHDANDVGDIDLRFRQCAIQLRLKQTHLLAVDANFRE